MIENFSSVYDKHLYSLNGRTQGRDFDGKFHPSAIGGCTKRLWYHHMCMPPVHRIPPKLRSCFDHGHAVHDWQQSVIKDIFDKMDGYSFSREVSIVTGKSDLDDPINVTDFASDNNIKGSADGVITTPEEIIVYELKTMAFKSWQNLKSPMEKHVAQASIYARAVNADRIMFQYYNKNNDLSKFFLISPSDDAVTQALGQIKDVYTHVKAGTVPSHKYNSYECGTCQFYYECRPEC